MEPAGSPGRPGEARGDDHDLPDLRPARRHRWLVQHLRRRQPADPGSTAAAQAPRPVSRPARHRTAALTVSGAGLLTAAGWTVHAAAGLAVAGLSCLILEWLTGDTGA